MEQICVAVCMKIANAHFFFGWDACLDMTVLLRLLSKYRIMAKPKQEDIAKFADMLAAMGTEPRLRIMRLLLSAHPEGMVVGEIASELEIAPSTLSHHLEKLKNEGLAKVCCRSSENVVF